MSASVRWPASRALPAGRDLRDSRLLLGGCAAATCIALLVSGVRIGELLLFASFQLAFAVLPGALLYLLLCGGKRRPFAEAVAIALPLGMAILVGCFVLSAALGERWLFAIYPPILLVAAGWPIYLRRTAVRSAVSASGRQADPRTGAEAGVLPTASLLADFRATTVACLIALCAILVTYLGLFAASPLPRAIRSASYYPDLIFNVSLVAELLHHWPFMNPSVSGVGLHYHIFVDIADAAAAQVTRLQPAEIVMRLEPALLLALIGVQLLALGRKLGGSLAAGLTALVLGLGAGEVNFSWRELAGGGLPVLGFLLSPSYQLGVVFFLALCIVLVDRLAPGAQPWGGDMLALAVLTLGAAGAKASVVPVLAGGMGLFVLGQLPIRGVQAQWSPTRWLPTHGPPTYRPPTSGPPTSGPPTHGPSTSGLPTRGPPTHGLPRRGSPRGLLAHRLREWSSATVGVYELAIVLAAGAVGYLLIYRGGGEGLALKPLSFLTYTGLASIYHRAGHSIAYALLCIPAAALALCLLSLSLVGVLLARDHWLGPERTRSPERLLLCLFVASLLPYVLLSVPGDSQVYFLVYGFLAASVVSAAGLTRAVRSLRLRMPDLLLPGLVCAGGVLAAIVLLWVKRSLAALLPAYALLALAAAVATWLAYRRLGAPAAGGRRALVSIGAVVLVCLTVASELFEQTAPTIQHWLDGTAPFDASAVGSRPGITADMLRGLTWIREHTPTSAVIAVNNHERAGEENAQYVYYSAFSERRVLLESWQYTPQGARYIALGRSATPFPQLLALGDAAVLGASPTALSLLRRRYGVRYVVIDRLHGPRSPRLYRVAPLVYANPDIAVYAVP